MRTKGFCKRAYCLRSRAYAAPQINHMRIPMECVLVLAPLPPSLTIYLSPSQNFEIDMLMVLINKINRYPFEQRTHYYKKKFTDALAIFTFLINLANDDGSDVGNNGLAFYLVRKIYMATSVICLKRSAENSRCVCLAFAEFITFFFFVL